MSAFQSVARVLGAFARRDFWTFRVFHALSGAALTIAAAGGGLFVTEKIKAEMSGYDKRIALMNQRYGRSTRPSSSSASPRPTPSRSVFFRRTTVFGRNSGSRWST